MVRASIRRCRFSTKPELPIVLKTLNENRIEGPYWNPLRLSDVLGMRSTPPSSGCDVLDRGLNRQSIRTEAATLPGDVPGLCICPLHVPKNHNASTRQRLNVWSPSG